MMQDILSMNSLGIFFFFGFIANLISYVIANVVFHIKVAGLNVRDTQILYRFGVQRSLHIRESNDPIKLFMSNLLVLVPTYHMWLNTIFVFGLLTSSNINGIVESIIRTDKFRIINIAHYKNK